MKTFFGGHPKKLFVIFVGNHSCAKTSQAKILRTPKNLPAPTPISGTTRVLSKGK